MRIHALLDGTMCLRRMWLTVEEATTRNLSLPQGQQWTPSLPWFVEGEDVNTSKITWDAEQVTLVAEAVTNRARLASDNLEHQECKIDSAILGLVNQSRSEWQTWAGTNFPSLTAPERNRMGTLCWVISVGIRKHIRNQ